MALDMASNAHLDQLAQVNPSDPSHVLIGMGVPIEASTRMLRFSLNEENARASVELTS